MLSEEILTALKGKRAVVTGGTGLIGREVVDMLCQAGASVISVSLDDIQLNKQAEYVHGDLTDFGFCQQITKDADYLFHVAGIKGSIEVTKSKPASFFVPLLMMNTNILEAARLNNVSKVVYTSSIGAYGPAEVFVEGQNDEAPPMDMFPGWAKRMAEMQIKAYQTQYGLNNFAVVRPCNVYGPGDNFDPNNAMVIPSLMHRIHHQENPVKIWGDGSAIRDFAFSRDVARGVIQALYYGTNGTYLNLGSGTGVSIKELVESLNSFIDFNYEFDTTKSNGFPRRIMDIKQAGEVIQYQPATSLIEGLKETWQWFQANATEYKNRKNYFAQSA